MQRISERRRLVPRQIFLTPRRPHPKWKWPRGSVLLGQCLSGEDVLVDARALSTHMHLIGASGYGKSKLLEGIARQFILAADGEPKGLILIDPHGTVIQAILRWVATYGLDKYRTIRVLDPASEEVFGINPFRHREGVDPAFSANTFANVVTSVCGDEEAKPQLAESLRALFYSLTVLGWTLLEAELLTDIADPLGVRQFIIANVRHPQILRFWSTLEALPAKIEEKLGAAVRRLMGFLLPLALRRVFSQRERVIDFRAAMDAREIVLIDLSYGNGRISADEAALLGRMIVADIFLSALGRPEGAPQAILAIDECHRYLTEDIANILDQARKFGLSLVLAHQHLGHLREAGEAMFRSVMTNTRVKAVFAGLDDDDSTLIARNICRGTFDLETPKHTLDKPTVVGQEYDWLRSESEGRSTSHAVGTTKSASEGKAVQHSTTKSWGTSFSETDTTSESETISDSYGTSESHTEERSGSSSQGNSWSDGSSRSGSRSQEYDQTGNQVGGPTVSSGWGANHSAGGSESSGSGWGSADSTGSSHATSTAYSSGSAYSTSTTTSESGAVTDGTTESHERSRGTTTTDSVSQQQTRGWAQTLRSVFKTLPTQAYSLDELIHLASVSIANLNVGEAIVKIGERPPVHLKTLRIKPGWASEAQVERLKRRLAAASPFITPLPEARANYIAWRQKLMAQLTGISYRLPLPLPGRTEASAANPAEKEPIPSPPLKDEGWG